MGFGDDAQMAKINADEAGFGFWLGEKLLQAPFKAFAPGKAGDRVYAAGIAKPL